MSPLCESYVPAEQRDAMEPFYPLRVFVCGQCFLVQLPTHVPGEAIFPEYAYYSSFSRSWLAHAEAYAEGMVTRFRLTPSSQVIADWEMALLWVLNLSDGGASLLDIAERSGIRFSVVRHAADTLHSAGLIRAT